MEERIKELSKYRFETCEEARKQIERAEKFSDAIRQYLTEHGIL